MNNKFDVIIIGAGPVGLTLANILGGQGVSTVLLEARDELINYPRAVGIDDEALRVMQSIGVVEDVLPHTVPDQSIRIVNGDRKVIAEISPKTREFGWPRRNGFVQPLVDQVLLEALGRFPSVDVRMSSEVVAMTETEAGVKVTVKSQGDEYELVAAYLTGCEGGRSLTRRHLGISFEGQTRVARGLVIDVADDPVGTPHAVFGADPERGYATLSLPHGIRRWEFTLKEGEQEALVDDDNFVYSLLAGHVVDPKKLNLIRRRVYTHHARVAGQFRVGRFFLAGDAAHVMPVVAGQGWNSGIRDAVNLGWKLATVCKGHADDRLLDSYESERRGHVESMVSLSLNMANVVTDSNKIRSATRDLAANIAKRIPVLKEKISSQGFKPAPQYTDGVVVPSPSYSFKSLAGRETEVSSAGSLFPQPFVSDENGQRVRLDDATGQGWRVIAWNNDPCRFIDETNLKALETLDAHLVTLVPAEQQEWCAERSTSVKVIGDKDGGVKKWFDARNYSIYVVRPDHVIAAECLPQDLDRILGEVFKKAGLIAR